VKNQGIALLMGLVLLAAISLLVLMAANSMLLQSRMSANYGARGQALAMATRATAAAVSWLYSRPDPERERDCTSGCQLPQAVYGPGQLPRNPEFEGAAWWRSHAFAEGIHPATLEPLTAQLTETDPPMWVMEELGYVTLAEPGVEPEIDGIGYYRILARGKGGSPGSIAVVESIIARPWYGDFSPLPYPPGQPRTRFCDQFSPVLPCGTQAWRQRR
jgi:Tfp pilus assembly protein PilX